MTHVKVWLNSEGISGFQVKFDVLSGITGYAQKVFLYGEPYVQDQIEVWDIPDGFEINGMTAKADLNGNHLLYLQFVAQNISGNTETAEFGTEAFVHNLNA